jgi:DNA-binding protein HU-beta
MEKALTKSQIAEEIATKNNITKKAAVEILEFIAQLAYENAKDTFTLPGLGKLVLVDRKARIGRNPATGAAIQIPAKREVKFHVAKAVKDAILGTP